MTARTAQRTLGKTGFKVSEIGLGCWQLGGDWGALPAEQANAILAAADESGVTFWDTADVYGGGKSEELIGAYAQQNPNSARTIATKAGRTPELYGEGYTREKLRAAIERSRERLQTECLDLLQLHCIPLEELRRGKVFEWLDECQSDGLIRHYGASVETVEQALYCLNNTQVASLQLIVNLLRQDMTEQVLPRAEEQDVGVIVRLGLASGLLSGKMQKDQAFAEDDQRNFNQDGQAFYVGETFAGLPFNTGVEFADRLKALCPEGMALPQMALRWLLDQPGVSSVITGASRPEQIQANAAASALPPLDDALHDELFQFYQAEVRQHIRGDI